MSHRIGALEELVLLAVGSLGSEAYAVSVQLRIEEAAARAPTMGAVYTALDRLEQKGMLQSRLGEATPEPGGRRKRFYELTRTGVRAIVEVRAAREALWGSLQLDQVGGRP